MKTIIFATVLAVFFSLTIAAQPRPVENTGKSTVRAAPAPESFEAKYEGGMFGYNAKITGSLKFDDANQRLVFRGKDQKEMFGIPYDALLVIYPNSQSVTTTTGNVISHIPLPGAGLAGLIKEKRRYLIVQFDDPDIDIKGAANFKLENKELLDSVIQTLGEKAKLTKRGDTYYRPKAAKTTI